MSLIYLRNSNGRRTSILRTYMLEENVGDISIPKASNLISFTFFITKSPLSSYYSDLGQPFITSSFNFPFASKLSIADWTIGVPETLSFYRVLQNGDINKEFTPFSVILWQYEMSSYWIFFIFWELAKNIKKLSVMDDLLRQRFRF